MKPDAFSMDCSKTHTGQENLIHTALTEYSSKSILYTMISCGKLLFKIYNTTKMSKDIC